MVGQHIRNLPWRRAALAVLLLGVLVVVASPSVANATSDDKLYWIEVSLLDDRIYRSDLDGTNVALLVSENMGGSPGFQVGPPSLAIDTINGHVYWTNPSLGEIRRADLDGSNVETVLNVPGIGALAIDPFGEYLYWSVITNQLSLPFGSEIYRSSLDGSGAGQLKSVDSLVMALDLDLARGLLYYGDEFGTISSMQANGVGSIVSSAAAQIPSSKFFADTWDLEVWEDGAAGTADLYWSTAIPEVESCPTIGPCVTFGESTTVTRAIQAAPSETLFAASNLDDVGGIAIDVKNNALYFRYQGGLGRSHLDGSAPSLLVANQEIADIELARTEVNFAPVGGISIDRGLAPLPEEGGSASLWVALAAGTLLVAMLGAAWLAGRRGSWSGPPR